MARLSQSPERTLRMSSLADLANASLSRLSHLVKRLEERGLVRREPDPADGRFTNAILTDLGFQTLAEAAPGTWPMSDRSSSTSCRPSSCDASARPRTVSCRASTPPKSTDPGHVRPGRTREGGGGAARSAPPSPGPRAVVLLRIPWGYAVAQRLANGTDSARPVTALAQHLDRLQRLRFGHGPPQGSVFVQVAEHLDANGLVRAAHAELGREPATRIRPATRSPAASSSAA